jgi:hypothetical protein
MKLRVPLPPRRWAGLDAHRPRPWKQTTRCIFCGVEASQTAEGALTKEHVYSNWTRRFVPRTTTMFRSLRATEHPDRTDFVFVKRPGDVRDWQVLCVCAACNNGWMRRQIDDRARPIMIPLIQRPTGSLIARPTADHRHLGGNEGYGRRVWRLRVCDDPSRTAKIFDETSSCSKNGVVCLDCTL